MTTNEIVLHYALPALLAALLCAALCAALVFITGHYVSEWTPVVRLGVLAASAYTGRRWWLRILCLQSLEDKPSDTQRAI